MTTFNQSMTHIFRTNTTQIIFEREISISMQLLFLIGGVGILFIAIANGANGWTFLPICCLLFGLLFMSGAFLVPYFMERYTPFKVIFNLEDEEMIIWMKDSLRSKISFNDIKDFEISEEKRSPSAANSKGIHYLHHHINLKRKNEAVFTVTSTTNKEEAIKILEYLKQNVKSSRKVKMESMPLPSKYVIDQGKATTLKHSKFQIEIDNGKVLFTESGHKVSFAISEFEKASYSYSGDFENSNASCFIYFKKSDQPREKINILISDSTPAELLNLEQWLQTEIESRKSISA